MEHSIPKTTELFLQENLLLPGDVILTSDISSSSLSSSTIRKILNSDFSHASVNFFGKSDYIGLRQDFIIETIISGVDITPFKNYIKNPNKRQIIGIRRIDFEWVDIDFRRLIAGVMLEYIKTKYSFRDAGLIAMKAVNLYAKIRIHLTKKNIFLAKRVQQNKYVPSRFICSGFVQYGYLESLKYFCEDSHGILNKKIFFNRINDVIFNPLLDENSPIETVLSTTPHHLSETTNLKWKYIIFDGFVYTINNKKDDRLQAKKLIKAIFEAHNFSKK